MKVQSVLGELSRDDLGVTSPHEHVFIDISAFYTPREIKGFDNSDSVKVSIENIGVLNRDPYALKDNLKMTDFEVQRRELEYFKRAGGQTIVDATTNGIGRDAAALRKISEATGVNIIAGAGYYVYSTHPKELEKMSVEEIAETIVREVEVGLDGTDIKAGIIGEIGISEVFNENERRVLRAAGIAQKKTGVAVNVHINPWTENGIEAADILLSEGVAPEKICISHIDVEGKLHYIHELLSRGVYVEFDNFGKEYYVDKAARNSGYGLFISDVERIRILKGLIEEGYVKQILLSCDVCLKTLLRTYGGWGYDHLLRNLYPVMLEEGICEKDIETMLKENPADFLCGKEG